MCLVTREFMKKIIKYFEIDNIIKIPFKNEESISIKEAFIISESDFLNILPKNGMNKFENDNNIEKTIIYLKNIKIEISIKDNKEIRDESIIKISNGPKSIDPPYPSSRNKNENGSKLDFKKKKQNLDKDNNTISTNDKTEKTDKTEKITEKTLTTRRISKKTENINFSNLIVNLQNFDSIQLSPKGLFNPSVYCFMNTCLQCLLSIPEFNNYFSEEIYTQDKKSKKSGTCNAVKELIEAYNSSSSSLKAPNSIYKVCHSFLEPNQQHDCQEFLRRFLSSLQEELNYNKKYNFPDKSTFDKAWQIYRDINPGFIDTLFSGLMRSSVICNKCGYRSDTYDPFLDLSVPFKRKSAETIENCLENYFTKEFIDCEYKCSSCKKKTSVYIYLII